MDQIRIAFFDVDGTLVNPQQGTVSARTVEALHRLQAKGVRICLATGRSPVALPDVGGVAFDAYLTFNGSLCYNGPQTIHSMPIPREDVCKVLRNAGALGRPVAVATQDRLAANGSDRDLADYYALAHLELTVADDFDDVLRQDIYQVLMGCRPQDHPAILKDVTGAKIAVSWDRAVDIIPAQGGKGVGIRQILAHYGLTPAQAIAFGDGNNDIDMLKAVGTGVAMGNASPDLKAVADDVCGHVAEDGVYHYCLRHGLI